MVMPKRVKELMFSWKSGRRRRRRRAWNMVQLALMWVVWRERNRRAFEGVESSSPQSSLRSLILFWCTQKVPYCIDEIGWSL
uniref:Putative ovule protein n=1 Tax=Solanum chacoense TaxID=4108 RepID=A0A0V0GU85_SOLCH